MRTILRAALLVVAATISLSAGTGQWPPVPRVNGPDDSTGTFSILGYDPDTGEIGAAVHSRVFSVGNGVLWAEAGVGAVATQAIVDVSYGPKSMELLRQGVAPKEIIQRILAQDPDPGYRGQKWQKAGRQFAVMNAKGEFAAHTGPEASTWAGDKQGKYCTAQGNILAGPAVVANMVEAFENSALDASGKPNHISYRLQAALEAGDAAGGDTRGKQSAAMIVVKKDGGVWLHNDVVLRLQVDDNPEPIKELRRLVDLAARQRPRR
jgi:uncharacterized Ntn-hydrolase superfamily protein